VRAARHRHLHPLCAHAAFTLPDALPPFNRAAQGAIFAAGLLQPLWPLAPTAATRNQYSYPNHPTLILISLRHFPSASGPRK